LTINSAGTTSFAERSRTATGISQVNAAGEVTFLENVNVLDDDTATDAVGPISS